MEIEEDSQIPILLVRPLLATTGAIIDVNRGKLNFEVGEEKIEFILAKLMKNPSLKDSCCLIDLIDAFVQKSASKPPQTNKLEDCLFDSTKVDKENIEAKVYGEVFDTSPISTNQIFKTLITQTHEPKQQKTRLGLNHCKPKKKKGVKKKRHGKMNLKYEPPHRRRNKKEEGCMAWMNKISWAPKIAKGDPRVSSVKEAPS